MNADSSFIIRHSSFPSAFTLTEILIVIGLIVVLIALAVPTFNFLSGGRSIDAAQNQISALLGRARSEAIGLQETRGVFFFIEPRTERVMMALVRETQRPDPGAPYTQPGGLVPEVSVFLDLVPDAEFVPLPSGVSLQVLDDVVIDPSTGREDDGYIGFNTYNRGNGPDDRNKDPLTPYGGVILFDGAGRLLHRSYALKTYLPNPQSGFDATRLGDLLYKPTGALKPRDHLPGSSNEVYDVVPAKYPSDPSAPQRVPMKSSPGILLFDKGAFRTRPLDPNNPGTRVWEADPEIYNSAGQEYGDGSQPWHEFSEERWLDENATALLVNRYNGTLVKSE